MNKPYSSRVRYPCLRVPVLTAALLTLLTAGCHRPVYNPSAQGGLTVKDPPSRVDFLAGPSDTSQQIRFQRHGVIVAAMLGEGPETQGQVQVHVTFEVPEGRVVTLVDKKVEISVSNHVAATATLSGGRFLSGFDGWSGRQFSDFSPDTPMKGTTAKKTSLGYGTDIKVCASDYAMFCFIAQVTVPGAGPFTLKLPRFSVNGAEQELPPVTVTQESFNELPGRVLGILGAGLGGGFEGGW